VEGLKALTNRKQDKLTVQEYQEKFQNTVDVFKAMAGLDTLPTILECKSISRPPNQNTLARHMTVSVKPNRSDSAPPFAIDFSRLMITNADRTWFGKLMKDTHTHRISPGP
jgi:hypothetical protein